MSTESTASPRDTANTQAPASTDGIADLSYEQARDELVAIVSRIEGGSASLEESMELWERGEALAAHCQAKLDQAQDQLDRGAAGAADPAETAGSAAAADETASDDEAESDDADA
ncbi:exodeoxyribonuclease VII small subunit [Ornithinimicrobium faecis]|uniref:Exodeoxyribonuclease 7 small subunit n=1 Tax=Ornithinimicrobium faecis TaxID=2934158 RepID=A0ABY4YW45_9MICO|nr:exodeoxyribonuclease VII small subunit [Ornithinimicrobium sp. HY1793]USQ80963.1 exodeoxyribonuclease VII small subunit [Ornithinimicrobium sp. HY1793]